MGDKQNFAVDVCGQLLLTFNSKKKVERQRKEVEVGGMKETG